MEGKFINNLKSTFKQIRDNRAEAINEDVEIAYRRKIEDGLAKIRKYDRSREDLLLDLNPNVVTSTLVVPSDFDADKFLEKDIAIGVSKRNDLIVLEITVDRYEELFGKYPDQDKVKAVLPDWHSKLTE
jgi:hypothetical protein